MLQPDRHLIGIAQRCTKLFHPVLYGFFAGHALQELLPIYGIDLIAYLDFARRAHPRKMRFFLVEREESHIVCHIVSALKVAAQAYDLDHMALPRTMKHHLIATFARDGVSTISKVPLQRVAYVQLAQGSYFSYEILCPHSVYPIQARPR